MRLLVSLVLTTLVVSAFAQEVLAAQIEAVNELPNVDVTLADENTYTVGDAAEETVAVVDPSSVIVSAINDAVGTVADSLSLDAPVAEDEPVIVELEEAVEEELAPVLEVAEEDTIVEEEVVPLVEEVVDEDPAPTLEVVEEDVSEVDETLLEGDDPMDVAVETAAPDVAPLEDDLDLEPTLTTDAKPEPEPEPTDTQGGAVFEIDVEETKPVLPVEEVIVGPVEPSTPTKKELKAIEKAIEKEKKAVEKFNDAVDKIAEIISIDLSVRDALPLPVNETVLEDLEEEVTTTPPPTTTTPAPEPITTPTPLSKCSEAAAAKCLTAQCQKREKCKAKCVKKGCALVKEKNKKKNKKNKKINKRKGDDKNKKNNKNNKNNNKNNNKRGGNQKSQKNNKNKNNKRKNIKSKLTRIGANRQSKDLDLGEDEITAAEGRSRKQKRKNKNKSRTEDLEAEAKDNYVPKSAEDGSLLATSEELMASVAVLTGFSNIRRKGNVKVDLSGRNPKFIATVVMGPLNVHLLNPASQTRKSEVTTELTAKMHFTARPARKRDKLSINEVVVEVPESVSVARFDLELDPEVISAAQDEVTSAIDTDRLARIIHHTLAAAFKEDNILQNLEDHPILMANRQKV